MSYTSKEGREKEATDASLTELQRSDYVWVLDLPPSKP